MTIQHRFKTQREAGQYLEARGWKYLRRSLGDKCYHIPTARQMGGRLIVKLKSGAWKIEIY